MGNKLGWCPRQAQSPRRHGAQRRRRGRNRAGRGRRRTSPSPRPSRFRRVAISIPQARRYSSDVAVTFGPDTIGCSVGCSSPSGAAGHGGCNRRGAARRASRSAERDPAAGAVRAAGAELFAHRNLGHGCRGGGGLFPAGRGQDAVRSPVAQHGTTGPGQCRCAHDPVAVSPVGWPVPGRRTGLRGHRSAAGAAVCRLRHRQHCVGAHRAAVAGHGGSNPHHRLLAYVEAVGWTVLLNSSVKYVVGRPRPYTEQSLDHPELRRRAVGGQSVVLLGPRIPQLSPWAPSSPRTCRARSGVVRWRRPARCRASCSARLLPGLVGYGVPAAGRDLARDRSATLAVRRPGGRDERALIAQLVYATHFDAEGQPRRRHLPLLTPIVATAPGAGRGPGPVKRRAIFLGLGAVGRFGRSEDDARGAGELGARQARGADRCPAGIPGASP